jgi:protein TonB
MRVTSAQPLGGDCFSHVSIRLPQLYGAIETQAEIVWMTASKKEAGVRFVDLPAEVREQIGMWVSLGRENRGARAQEERPRNVEHGLSPVAAVVAMSSGLASGESVCQSWPLTEARRAEFERMFPSENRATNSRVVPASKVNALTEPVETTATDAASAVCVVAPELALTNAFEDESVLNAEMDRKIGDSLASVAPALRPATEAFPPCAPLLQPISDRSFPTAIRTESRVLASETHERSMWPIAALAIALVVIFFGLGFAVGPAFLQDWMKAHHPPQMIVEKLSGIKTSRKNVELSDQHASNDAAPRLNVPAGDHGAAPEPPHSAGENTTGNSAPNENERGDGATSQTSEKPDKRASRIKTPLASVSSLSQAFMSKDEPKSESSKKSTGSTNPAVNAGEIFDAPAAPAAPSEPASSARTPTEKPYATKPESSEHLEMTPRVPAEKALPSAAANAPLRAAGTEPQTAKTPSAIGGAAENSLSATTSATHATNPPTEQPAPGVAPSSAASAPPAPATPPVRTAGPAASAANPPQSFFPIVAPAAGSAPRMLELPPERVMDTVTVSIYALQFVFVPAQPGPETSHKPERVQMGERISNIEPVYPAQAAQKKMGGTVRLRATVGKDGAMESVRVLSGPALLIPSASDAVWQWKYRPALLEHQPIEMREDITIEFRPIR